MDFIVFYGSQVYGEYPGPVPLGLPDGCYMFSRSQKVWMHRREWGWEGSSFKDLPKPLKAMALIMGLN